MNALDLYLRLRGLQGEDVYMMVKEMTANKTELMTECV